MTEKPKTTQRQRLIIVGVVMLLVGMAGAGLITGNGQQPESNSMAEEHTVRFSATENESVDRYVIHITDGVVCEVSTDDTGTEESNCTKNPERALELLNYVGFYEHHPDAPRPPVNETAD